MCQHICHRTTRSKVLAHAQWLNVGSPFLCNCSKIIETRAKLQPIINKKKDHLISLRDKTCASLLGFNLKSKLRIIRGKVSLSKLSQCLSIPDSIRTLLLREKIDFKI